MGRTLSPIQFILIQSISILFPTRPALDYQAMHLLTRWILTYYDIFYSCQECMHGFPIATEMETLEERD